MSEFFATLLAKAALMLLEALIIRLVQSLVTSTVLNVRLGEAA